MSHTAEAKPLSHRSGRFQKFALILEWSLTAAWLVFHIRFFFHAGGLWRDEVNSVDLSNSTRISDVVNNLQYDSFPLLWHLILRDPVREWNAGPLFNWPVRVADFVAHHAKSEQPLDVPVEGVSGYERPDVKVVTGWIDDAGH
jgi:hypothetical protein